MKIQLAGMGGLALLLAACGSGSDDAPAGDSSEAADAAATAGDAVTSADEANPDTGATPAETDAAQSAAAEAGASVASAAIEEPAMFAVCSACHSVEPGKHGIGPSLAGIYGTKAGEVAGFEFSEPMLASGLVWNDANLDKYLADPRGVVPGTKMAYNGLKNEAQRKEIIAYIKSL
jgi:cytochrome c2